jgi:predicted phosphodiesterase
VEDLTQTMRLQNPMRFAAISDIHGNHLALEAVLEDIARQGVTDIVNLGDCFSGPLDPARTAEILVPLGLPTIAGNHDRALVEVRDGKVDPFDRSAFESLRPEDFAWLRTLPATLVHGDKVLLTHGSPHGDLDMWIDGFEANGHVALRDYASIAVRAEGVPQSLILCGHTHEPRSIQLRDGRQIVNPGSVGDPGYAIGGSVRRTWQVGSPHARYAIIAETTAGWDVTFRNVPYDHEAMARLAAENGDPDWASALASGWVDD